MLVKELLELPVGSQVLEELKITKTMPGVVESLKHGPHFIRWADGLCHISIRLDTRQRRIYCDAHGDSTQSMYTHSSWI